MQSTLMVNGVERRTVAVRGKMYIIIGRKLCKLYRKEVKNKSRRNGKGQTLVLKGICQYCHKEFFGILMTLRKFCSNKCSAKYNNENGILKRIKKTDNEKLRLIAKDIIGNLIKSGRIIRPKQCSNCESFCKPDFHHPDYAKPLEGMWLCKSCHKKLHYGHDIKGKLTIYNIK